MDQHVLVRHVVIVTGKQLGGVAGLELNEVGDVVSVVDHGIGDRLPLLEQKLAAVDITGEGAGLVPPRDIGIQVRAGEVFLARQTHFLGGRSEGVPDEPVQPVANSLVEGGLQIVPKGLLPLRSDAGHSLRRHNGLAIDVRGAGGLLHKEALFVASPVRGRPRPELGLRKGAGAEGLESVDGSTVRSARFGMDTEPGTPRQFGKRGIVLRDDQVADGPPEVIQKTIAGVAVSHDAAGNHGKVGQ